MAFGYYQYSRVIYSRTFRLRAELVNILNESSMSESGGDSMWNEQELNEASVIDVSSEKENINEQLVGYLEKEKEIAEKVKMCETSEKKNE